MTPAASSAEGTDQLSLHGFVKMTWCIEGAGEPVLFRLWRPPLTLGCSLEKQQALAPESLWFPAPSNQQQRWEQPKQKSPSHLTDKQGLTLCFRNAPQLNLSGKHDGFYFKQKRTKRQPATLAPPAQHRYSNIYQPGCSRVWALIFTFPPQPALISTPRSLRLLASVEDWGLCITELKSSCLDLWDSPS